MKLHLGPFKLEIVRGVDAESYLESFLVSAVAAIPVISLLLRCDCMSTRLRDRMRMGLAQRVAF